MYRALAARDPAFDGIFYVAVKTTRIFCRSVCHARTPKRENVEFYARPARRAVRGLPSVSALPAARAGAAAAAAGRKAARRGRSRPVRTTARGGSRTHGHRPIDRAARVPALLRHELSRLPPRAAHGHGTDRRTERGKACSTCSSITDSNRRAVFAKPSPRSSAPRPASRATSTACTQNGSRRRSAPMLALANDAGLYLLEFVDRRGLEREVQALRRRLTQHVVPGEHRYLDQHRRGARGLFRGPFAELHDAVAARAARRSSVRYGRRCARFPPGRRVAYADVAAKIGRPAAVRAVGRANGDNKLAIVVPCHRVIGADGTLTGYGGGLWRKAWLLEHERTITACPRPARAGACTACRRRGLKDVRRPISRACLCWRRSGAALSPSSALPRPSLDRSGLPKAASLSRSPMLLAARAVARQGATHCASAGATSWSSASSIRRCRSRCSASPGSTSPHRPRRFSTRPARFSALSSPRCGSRIRLPLPKLAGMALGLAGVVLLVGWRPEPLTGLALVGGAGMPCRVAVLRHRQRLRQGAHDRRAQFRDRALQSARCGDRARAGAAVRSPARADHRYSSPPMCSRWRSASTAIAYLLYFQADRDIGPARALTRNVSDPAFRRSLGLPVSGRAADAINMLLGGSLILGGTWLAMRGGIAPRRVRPRIAS